MGRHTPTPNRSKHLSQTNLDPPTTEARPWLIWDGECGVCCWWVEWARRRGAGDRFQIVSYQEAPEPPMTQDLRTRARRSVLVVSSDGQNLQTGRACLFVLDAIGRRGAARFWGTPPMYWLFELGYRVVARNRPFFSRFLSRNPKACRAKEGA